MRTGYRLLFVVMGVVVCVIQLCIPSRHELILALFKENLQSHCGWYEVNGRLSKSIEFLALFQSCISSLLMPSSSVRYDPTIGIAPQPRSQPHSFLSSDLPLLRQRTHTPLPALLMDNPTSCHSPTPPDKKNTVAYGQPPICAPMHSCLFTTSLT